MSDRFAAIAANHAASTARGKPCPYRLMIGWLIVEVQRLRDLLAFAVMRAERADRATKTRN